MAAEITFTKDALECLTELQLEKLAMLNQRFDGAERCRVQRDFSVGDESNQWIVAAFEYAPRSRNTDQLPPFVVGISPKGESHS